MKKTKKILTLFFATLITFACVSSYAQEKAQNKPIVEVNEKGEVVKVQSLSSALNIENKTQNFVGGYEAFLEKYNLNSSYLGQGIATLVLFILICVLMYVIRLGVKKLKNKTDSLQKKLSLEHKRFGFYINFLRNVACIAIALIAIHTLGIIWKLPFLTFMQTSVGIKIITTLLNIIFSTVIVIAIWELIVSIIDYNLNKAKQNQINRWQTLLPIARNIVTIIFAMLLMFLVLPELGINVVPLLAGFSIFGIAIAFGAQGLMKDFITGFIIISEDLINVGDMVTIGGYCGMVEKITVRKIQLRDFYGTVYTVPYNNIDIIENYNKGYGIFMTEVGIAYKEDPEVVIEYIKEIDEEIRQVESVKDFILEDPMNVMGIDKFADSAIMIKVQIKTQAMWQWTVGREFNRLLKRKFDQKGVEIPFPHHTVYFGNNQKSKSSQSRVAILSQKGKDVQQSKPINMDEAKGDHPGDD